MLTVEIVEVVRLREQMHRVREIRNLEAEIDVINDKLTSPGSIKYTDMPKSQNPFDKQTMLLAQKMDKENKLKRLITTAQKEKVILENIINRISLLPETGKGPMNSIYQDILRYKYLYDYTWNEINELLNGNDENFINVCDSKLRNLYTWNGQALNKFIKCQKDIKPSK